MHILFYNEIDPENIPKLDRVINFLKADDFHSANVKKVGVNLYRARLNKADRLLFALYKSKHQTVILILEHIKNHAYDKSRFLRRGVKINEQLIPSIEKLKLDQLETLPHLKQDANYFNLLQKPITFDLAQQQIFSLPIPIIIIGTAGSGKTLLLLEKMKKLQGKVLYVTQSSYLSRHSQSLYFSNKFRSHHQSVSFLCFQSFLDSIAVQSGIAMNFNHFKQWFNKHLNSSPIKDIQAVYEEFKGVITGEAGNTAYLSYHQYLALGIKECIFPHACRGDVYELFKRYLDFLKNSDFYEHNLVSFDYLSRRKKKYDYLVVDEVQDFSPIQLQLLLNSLNKVNHFLLCGDANQVVYPNFFSWTRIKSLFFSTTSHKPLKTLNPLGSGTTLTQILNTNYRNSISIITLANKLLRIKHYRFGSIDKESHYEMKASEHELGKLAFLSGDQSTLKSINHKTHASKKFAIIVLYEELKPIAAKHFKTPLIFSIQECKGLEYENIILFNMISSAEQDFTELCNEVTTQTLEEPMSYSRNKDKTDKSLEKYKFFINALFVAVTRAQVNLYWIEEATKHPLLQLLNPSDSEHSVTDIELYTSNVDEWQQEASILDKQGRSEQAQHIRKEILQQLAPPWEVIAGENIATLFNVALVQGDKKAKLSLFEYALVYEDHAARNALMEADFSPALYPENGMELLIQKHFIIYQQQRIDAIRRQMSKYGVDFRNPFNQTPLMIGAWLGKDHVIQLANSLNADPLLANNMGFNPFQIMLEQACLHQSYAKDNLPSIYPLLKPDSLNIRIDDQLIQLEHHQPEFLLINLMVALFYRILPENMVFTNGAYSADNLTQAIAHWPSGILPDEFSQSDYINKILARHQLQTIDAIDGEEEAKDQEEMTEYSLPLFIQVCPDHYLLNSNIMLQAEGQWLSIYNILWFDDLALGHQGRLDELDPNFLYNEILVAKIFSYKEILGIKSF